MEALMYIANGNRRRMIGEASRHQRDDTLRQWVEELLASERFGTTAADDIRYTVARKIRLGIAKAS